MAPKALSPFKLGAFFSFLIFQFSCQNKSASEVAKIRKLDYSIDTSKIPKDTLLVSNPYISQINGEYYLGKNKFSGIIKKQYSNDNISSLESVYQGVLHGTYKSFYENGQPFEVRQYKNNLSTGRHFGYWPNGKMKFDFTYFEEKKEGLQKRWYLSGKPYIISNYENDKEAGLQQAWRENGKLYINYVAKDGYNYGLQQTALCYTLINQELKSE